MKRIRFSTGYHKNSTNSGISPIVLGASIERRYQFSDHKKTTTSIYFPFCPSVPRRKIPVHSIEIHLIQNIKRARENRYLNLSFWSRRSFRFDSQFLASLNANNFFLRDQACYLLLNCREEWHPVPLFLWDLSACYCSPPFSFTSDFQSRYLLRNLSAVRKHPELLTAFTSSVISFHACSLLDAKSIEFGSPCTCCFLLSTRKSMPLFLSPINLHHFSPFPPFK